MTMQPDNKPSLADQIATLKAQFYSANGQSIRSFENLVELLATEIIQKNSLLQQLSQKIKELEEESKNCTCKEVKNELDDK